MTYVQRQRARNFKAEYAWLRRLQLRYTSAGKSTPAATIRMIAAYNADPFVIEWKAAEVARLSAL